MTRSTAGLTSSRGQRCDGAKPACAQCTRAQKADGCAYDDGRGKTRTQALREKIARLEEEIAKLRDPDSAAALHAQSIFLHDPHQSGGEPSSRPATAVSQTFDFESLSDFGLGGERDYSGGVQRPNRPTSGVFSYSLSPPIPQGHGHGRSPSGSSTKGSDSPGSSPLGSPSPSTVGSVSLSVGGPTASPYGSFIGEHSILISRMIGTYYH